MLLVSTALLVLAAAQGCPNIAGKQTVRPAFLLDPHNDKMMSDSVSNKSRVKQHRMGASELHKAAPAIASVTGIRAEICKEQEQVINRLKQQYLTDARCEEGVHGEKNLGNASKKRTNPRGRHGKAADSANCELARKQATTQHGRTKSRSKTKVLESHLRWSNSSVFLSSSSSTDDDLAIYESGNGTFATVGPENTRDEQHPVSESLESPFSEQDSLKVIGVKGKTLATAPCVHAPERSACNSSGSYYAIGAGCKSQRPTTLDK